MLPVTAYMNSLFCYLMVKVIKSLFLQGNQGEPGVGVQVKQLQLYFKSLKTDSVVLVPGHLSI